MHDGLSLAARGDERAGRLGLELPAFLFLTGFAFSADLRWSRGVGEFGVRHAHHLVGDAVRLVLERIVDVSDSELRLLDACLVKPESAEQGSRLRSVCPFRWKYWDRVEIPRDTGGCLTGAQARLGSSFRCCDNSCSW